MGDDRRRHNVALIGPAGAGKTTLLESMLFVSGTIARKGRVADGTTVGDFSAEARARQTTLEVAAVHFEHEGQAFTALDCPGSVEFAHEARAAVLGCDLAVVVVEPLLERAVAAAPVLHFLDEHAVPHLVFINKMDKADVRYRDLLDALRAMSARPVVPRQYAIGRGPGLVGYIDLVSEDAFAFKPGGPSDQIPLPPDYRDREQAARREMLETLADFDDDLLTILLDDGEPPAETIRRDLRRSLGADQVVPVLLGVADADMGVRRLLRSLAEEAPGPERRAAALGVDGDGAAAVQILKTWFQPHTGKMALARVWRGTVRDGMALGEARVGSVLRPFADQQQPLGVAAAGDIVTLTKLDGARAGDLLSEGAPLSPPVPLPEPGVLHAVALSARQRADEVKLSAALAKLLDEDRGLRLEHDAETRQTLLWGQGEIHLKVAAGRLEARYNVPVETRPPRIACRETIRKPAHAHGRHKKQSGGHGQFGDVKIEVTPLPRGEGFAFVNKVVGGAVPRQFIPAVEAGARECLQSGPSGFPVVDVAVTLLDGQFHAVDSNELSFKMATALAIRDALPRCEPVLLEPVLAVTVSAPTAYTARALQIVAARRGQILGYEPKEGWAGWDAVRAYLPQAEMGGFILDLRSASQGTGYFEWSHDHLQEVPARLAAELVERQRALAA